VPEKLLFALKKAREKTLYSSVKILWNQPDSCSTLWERDAGGRPNTCWL